MLRHAVLVKQSTRASSPMYYVNVLHSLTDHGLYIGSTSDLRRRFRQHQEGASSSTVGRRPWRLIYYEAYMEESDALGRERFLKSGTGRTYLKKQCRAYFAEHPLRTTA